MTNEMSQVYSALSGIAAKYFGKRLIFTSGDRTCAHQKEVSQAVSSYHLIGQAFDAQLYPYDKAQQAQLGRLAEHWGFRWGGRFKPYDDVHFDNGLRVRPGRCAT
jgi:D-alanyl-D-alanine carboxypeptidase